MSQMQSYKFSVRVLLILLFYSFNQSAFSQELISSSGSEFKNEQLQMSWSLGETIIETFENSNLKLSQGFLQSNLKITAIEEIPGIDFSLNVFPNPVVDYLTLKTNHNQVNKLRYLLYDSRGRLLKQSDVLSEETKIPMHTYVPASYYLKIVEDKTQLKTFKIVKTK